MRSSRVVAVGCAGSVAMPPSGRPTVPGPAVSVGPALTCSVTAWQVCTENTIARAVSVCAGTSMKLSDGVSSPTAMTPPAHGAALQNSSRPAVMSSTINSISAHGGWNCVPHSTTKP
jgi:hypothetical protein